MLPILGGLVSAWHGGQIIGGSPKILKAFVWAFPFALVCVPYNGYLALPCLLLCMLGKNTGHGRVFVPSVPLDITKKPEQLERITGFLYGRISDVAYKATTMAVIGLAAVSGLVIPLLYYNPAAGALLMLGGLFKGINAMIFDKNTQAREYADGVCAYTALYTVMIWM